jgi:hypothetical protein
MGRISNTFIAFASLLFALLLIIHHGYKHRPGGEYPLYGVDQYFQLSDVGNFTTLNHEMFVILFTIVGLSILSFHHWFSL